MARMNWAFSLKRSCAVFVVFLVFYAPLQVHAIQTDRVTTFKDEKGWKLKVNGEDFYVKGVVWGYTPRNENYNYNLWGKSDDFIREVLDHDFGLMKKAGINSIRAFSTIPPRWVTYAYEKYGIMTALNPLMGRYGASIDGVWKPVTDYSDPRTREVLKAEILEIVEKYKNTPGLLMYALGNESNYGLEWSASFEIENLPVGEQQKEKARYLYSLYNEIISEAKAIDQNHLFTIVNGDIQYIDLIRKYDTELDVLGVNAYRGISFTDLWKEVDEKLDLPVLFFEFGADAFNARNYAEDQAAQASFLKAQWLEMYSKSYGNGQQGNSIGGYVFEWRDEWWKYKQTENLDIHDTHASWANGGYTYDHVEGQDNMNEEWWGITRLGSMNADGVYVAEPRMAYDVLSEIWKIDPYKYKIEAIRNDIKNIDMDEYYALRADVRLLKSEYEQNRKFAMTGGSLEVEFVGNGFDSNIREDGENGINTTNGQMVFLDFEFNPTNRISGQLSLNVLGNVADKTMEISYGRRGLPIVVQGSEIDALSVPGQEATEIVLTDRERVEIYDYDATYQTDDYDLLTFYHVPRYHWGYEGDFYGLLRETTDMEGQDIWNSKAPYGAEYIGKQSMDGLKIVLGPEVYWGANPKFMLKYEFKAWNTDFAFIHSEDVARKDTSASATEATERQSRQTTFYAKKNITSGSTLELGAIVASTEKVGDKYTRIENGNVILDEIRPEDTLGIKAKYSFDIGSSRAYAGLNYGGLVADGGDALIEFGNSLPYSAYGNKKEVEGGIMINFDTISIFPRFLYRDNIVDANPSVEPVTSGTSLDPGISPRNREDDPFAVLDNRAARSGEIFFTYDPTPSTGFYDWDNDMRENADFAFNLGVNYTSYPTPTDSYLFFYEPAGVNAAFGEGLPEEDVWKVMSKMVFNTDGGQKIVTRLEAGRQQSTGLADGGTRDYYQAEAKFTLTNNHIISGYIKKDAWGPYDYFRQFNITYPYQFKLDYAILMDNRKDELRSSKYGIRTLFRTLDENAPDNEYDGGRNDYMFEIIAYMKIAF